jgi:hypothetical protein
MKPSRPALLRRTTPRSRPQTEPRFYPPKATSSAASISPLPALMYRRTSNEAWRFCTT